MTAEEVIMSMWVAMDDESKLRLLEQSPEVYRILLLITEGQPGDAEEGKEAILLDCLKRKDFKFMDALREEWREPLTGGPF